ncbi:Uncharacterized protein SCF082_LOCUS8994 [Durusdinium trenchii]
MQSGKRSFALQTQPVTGDLHILQLEEAQILAGVAYEISVHLDWGRGLLELFIDGAGVLRNVPFQADLVPRYIGLYNWRSRASCGFSEIIVGNARPYPQAKSQHAWRVSESRQGTEQGTSAWRRHRMWVSLLTALILVLLVAVAIHRTLAL